MNNPSDFSNLPKPVTRFAPSPTGYLHIGGARTALLNYLYAKAKGGTFLLRIEDTDRARSTEDAVNKILEGMEWLGLKSDRPPLFQFARAGRHVEVANQLLAEGKAYRCYATPEELQTMRAEQKAQGLPERYDGRWRNRTDGPEGQPYVIRLKSPTEGETVIDDQVQGRVVQQNEILDDFILLRSDGTPTYMLAVVVDDHDMGVTHVIRGDDHLTNSFRQLALIKALGWPEPTYAHVPLIHGPDGAKLSKRHGALGVEAYRDELGILPEALENYLLRLGWSHGDTELITRDEVVKIFDLGGIGRSPSRFDLKKLESVNSHYLRGADKQRLADLILARVDDSFSDLPENINDLLLSSIDDLVQRAKNLNELAASADYLYRKRPLVMDESTGRLLDDAGRDLLARLHAALAKIDSWERDLLETTARQVAEDAGVGLGKVAGPLRAALTGRANSPSAFSIMAALGRDESLGRIDDVLGSKAS